MGPDTKAIVDQLGSTLSGIGVAAIDCDLPQVKDDLSAGAAWFGGEVRLAFDEDRVVFSSWAGSEPVLVFREQTLHGPKLIVADCEWTDLVGKVLTSAEFRRSADELQCAKLTFGDVHQVWLAIGGPGGGHYEVGPGDEIYLGTRPPSGSDEMQSLDIVKATAQ